MKNLFAIVLFASFISYVNASTTIDFSPNRNVVSCGPTTVYFVYNNAIDADLVFWDFGDGTGANTPNPSHTYTNTGKYTVKLIIIENNERDSIVKTDFIVIKPAPVAQLKIEGKPDGMQNQYLFTSNSTHNADSFDSEKWFVNNDTLSGKNVSYRFMQKGDYNIKLLVTNNYGCSSESSTSLTILNDVEENVGLTDNNTISFNAFPNPADDHLVIHTSELNPLVTITDLLGKEYKLNYSNGSDKLVIDTHQLKSGVYFVCVENAGKRSVKRINIFH